MIYGISPVFPKPLRGGIRTGKTGKAWNSNANREYSGKSSANHDPGSITRTAFAI
jgi:hypothetical protein